MSISLFTNKSCSLTGSLVGLVPKMPHGIVHFLHLPRMVLHSSTSNIQSTFDREINHMRGAHLSKALAYFSKSDIAFSDNCNP